MNSRESRSWDGQHNVHCSVNSSLAGDGDHAMVAGVAQPASACTWICQHIRCDVVASVLKELLKCWPTSTTMHSHKNTCCRYLAAVIHGCTCLFAAADRPMHDEAGFICPSWIP